ncbi:MAG: FAD-binding oxidoreductase [Sphingobacteriales bacterium]|nr:MAG: FAD-binding oxidoreductase [Sphingobacteriales bacterium]
MHETGRFLIGFTSFLLILIAISGMILVVHRQQSFKRFFAKIERGSFAQYYHVLFGRIALLPILIVAITGTWLSVVRFELIREDEFTGQINPDSLNTEPALPVSGFKIFQQITLPEVKSVQFPFAEDPEEFYVAKLEDREITVNQLTGDLLLEQKYSTATKMSSLSLRLHTGRSGIIWAIILAITCGYILFFIYSGFLITFKRRKNRLTNKFSPEESKVVILVGSENGSTMQYARAVYKQLTAQGEKVYLADLDKYRLYPAMEDLIVMTSTYGLGDPPSNAHHFSKLLQKLPQSRNIRFSVLAFGSRAYADYCRYGMEVDQWLSEQSWAMRATGLMTVNDRSPQDFSAWCDEWSEHSGRKIHITRDLLADNHKELQTFQVLSKSMDLDDTFLIRLRGRRRLAVASGDLLAVYPKNDHRERLYSIGVIDGDIQLSVRLHEHGLGSAFLHASSPGGSLSARIIKNQHFHFPKGNRPVIMICNGTGIAPFLGMIANNVRSVPCYLYCGFRREASFGHYKEFLSNRLATGQLSEQHLAFSREGTHQYVTHLLNRDEEQIASLVSTEAVLMICGSLSMQADVLALLEAIFVARLGYGLDALKERGQLLTDCY